jgi:hypothetical protein
VNMIVQYIERELKAVALFDKNICAFKIKNQRVERIRISYSVQCYPKTQWKRVLSTTLIMIRCVETESTTFCRRRITIH